MLLKEEFMRKLEKLRLISPLGTDAERLARWLNEWSFLLASLNGIDDMNHYEENIDNDKANHRDVLLGGGVAPFDCNIEIGQIRLMAPVANENMVFIVIISVAEGGDVCFIPFGSLTEPATPDELLSGRDKDVIRIYCLWNMRVVSATIIGKSWIVDRLDCNELERLLRAVNIYKSDICLPDDLLMDTGPSLVHPEDPRREYRNYEYNRIDLALSDKSVVRDNMIIYDVNENQEILKAAESSESYNA